MKKLVGELHRAVQASKLPVDVDRSRPAATQKVIPPE